MTRIIAALLGLMIIATGAIAGGGRYTTQASTLANVEGNFDVWQADLVVYIQTDDRDKPTFDVLNNDVVLIERQMKVGPEIGELVKFQGTSIRRFDISLKNRKEYLYLPEGPIMDVRGHGKVLMVLQKCFDLNAKNEVDARLRTAYPKEKMPAHFERNSKLVIERKDALIGAALYMEWGKNNTPTNSYWTRPTNEGVSNHGGQIGTWLADNPFQSNFSTLWVAGSMSKPGSPAVVPNNGFPPSVTKMVVWQADGVYQFYHLDPKDTVVTEHRHYSPKPVAVEATSWGQIKAQLK